MVDAFPLLLELVLFLFLDLLDEILVRIPVDQRLLILYLDCCRLPLDLN